jgi:CheY-like chemotaxis protein
MDRLLPFLATLNRLLAVHAGGAITSVMPESAARENVLIRNPRDAQARAGTIRLLQVLAAAALLLPVLFFAFASALSYRATYALAGQASSSAEKKSEPRRGRPGECILVVEDDAEVRAYVVETLRGLGYDVLEAALALMDRHRSISLLLTDVVMPGQNGRKLADAARQRQASLKVPYMTGYSRNVIVHQGRLDPGVELLQKPPTSEQLAATVRKVLDA